jgi:hypothetical protein
VVIIFPEGETISEADEDGLFSTEISLKGGVNEINVFAYDLETDSEVEQTLTVVYSTAEI